MSHFPLFAIDVLRTTDIRPVLKLIPPISDEFTVGCGDDIEVRARSWALKLHVLLVKGVPACAHGLYLMDMCPTGSNCCGAFDHTTLWMPDRGPGSRLAANPPERPFLLTQPYMKAIPPSATTYARAHGLRVSSWPKLDGWYGHGTLPIRFSLPENWPMWPIEREAEAMFSARPVLWPEDSAEDIHQ